MADQTSQVIGKMLFELSWQQFKTQNHIRTLNENEQIRQYRFYLDSLSNQRIYQNKGAGACLILQENDRLLLQENGNGLIWCF